MRNTVVMPTCNRPGDIVVVLTCLMKQTLLVDELIIVDSSDIPLLYNPDFVALFSSKNFLSNLVYQHVTTKGAALQRNKGIALATGDIIHFMDDDMVVPPDYIASMHACFLSGDYAGGMAALPVAPKKYSFNRLLRSVFLMQRQHGSGRFTWSGMPLHPYGTAGFKDVEVLNGCASYLRCVVQQFLFDENLGVYSYMEDCDLSWRVSRRFRLFYNPAIVLEHAVSQVNRQSTVENRRIFIRNYSYLFFKNFFKLNKLRVFAYSWTIIGLFVESLIARNGIYIIGYYRGLYAYFRKGMV